MKQTKGNDSQDAEIQGYLHSLSPMKNARRKQTPYFDFLSQTSDIPTKSPEEYIFCEPQQRKNLLELFQKNPPVKITCRQRGSLQLAFLQQMKNSKSKKN